MQFHLIWQCEKFQVLCTTHCKESKCHSWTNQEQVLLTAEACYQILSDPLWDLWWKSGNGAGFFSKRLYNYPFLQALIQYATAPPHSYHYWLKSKFVECLLPFSSEAVYHLHVSCWQLQILKYRILKNLLYVYKVWFLPEHKLQELKTKYQIKYLDRRGMK